MVRAAGEVDLHVPVRDVLVGRRVRDGFEVREDHEPGDCLPHLALDALDERVAASTEAAVAAIGLDEATVREVLAASGDEIYSIVVALEA